MEKATSFQDDRVLENGESHELSGRQGVGEWRKPRAFRKTGCWRMEKATSFQEDRVLENRESHELSG